jgi:hypothetical protein
MNKTVSLHWSYNHNLDWNNIFLISHLKMCPPPLRTLFQNHVCLVLIIIFTGDFFTFSHIFIENFKFQIQAIGGEIDVASCVHKHEPEDIISCTRCLITTDGHVVILFFTG